MPGGLLDIPAHVDRTDNGVKQVGWAYRFGNDRFYIQVIEVHLASVSEGCQHHDNLTRHPLLRFHPSDQGKTVGNRHVGINENKINRTPGSHGPSEYFLGLFHGGCSLRVYLPAFKHF